MQDFEKLGVFYLGREYDIHTKTKGTEPLLYDSRDMVTHGVCVGMTGSGKTGLCLGILEEAAIDGIPVIAIDPKGDIPNLMLTFPDLAPSDFEPWINEEDARRKGITPSEYAKQQAELWRNGLESWGQNGERIRNLKESADVVTFTPGSTAGIPVSVLKSFSAPSEEVISDKELLGERISTAASSLLGLAGINADPMQSREHILISSIFEQAWRDGRDLDLNSLILAIQKPPISKIGVLDLESFFPSKDRFNLALAFNNLLASPGFSTWMDGVPLDIQSILYTPTGKPRISIFYLAHLGENERMFFVSLLLNQIVSWMRSQSGTTSLRALVYMDEIFGYFPPVANPPSKKPLLTLLKQARAYGVGVLLATQNPVDLDYKGLANTGTWLIGRLQTERDKARVIEALIGATAAAGGSLDRASLDATLAGLGNRIFLMHNTHDDTPVTFETRWVMSYLRGPLARDQIKLLSDPIRAQFADQKTVASVTDKSGSAPVLPPDVRQMFAPVRGTATGGQQLFLVPSLLGVASTHIMDAKIGIDTTIETVVTARFPADAALDPWGSAVSVDLAVEDLGREAPAGAYFAELPDMASKSRSYTGWEREFVSWLFRSQKVEVLKSPSTGAFSKVDEPERDFRVRLTQSHREERDRQIDALRKKYASRANMLQERIKRAEEALERTKSTAKAQKIQGLISFGSAILGGLLGQKRMSATNMGRVATSARGIGRTMQAGESVSRAESIVEDREAALADLETEMNKEIEELQNKIDPQNETFETITIRPKRTNITARIVSLIWLPHWRHTDGTMTPAWE